MATTVVHCNKGPFDLFIGRKFATNQHYGNPFAFQKSKCKVVMVKDRAESIACFKAWLEGKAHHDVEPERRLWILANLYKLKGKKLGCYCSPQACHGDILARMADEVDE